MVDGADHVAIARQFHKGRGVAAFHAERAVGKHDQRVPPIGHLRIPEFDVDFPVLAGVGECFDAAHVRVGVVGRGDGVPAGHFGGRCCGRIRAGVTTIKTSTASRAPVTRSARPGYCPCSTLLAQQGPCAERGPDEQQCGKPVPAQAPLEDRDQRQDDKHGQRAQTQGNFGPARDWLSWRCNRSEAASTTKAMMTTSVPMVFLHPLVRRVVPLDQCSDAQSSTVLAVRYQPFGGISAWPADQCHRLMSSFANTGRRSSSAIRLARVVLPVHGKPVMMASKGVCMVSTSRDGAVPARIIYGAAGFNQFILWSVAEDCGIARLCGLHGKREIPSHSAYKIIMALVPKRGDERRLAVTQVIWRGGRAGHLSSIVYTRPRGPPTGGTCPALRSDQEKMFWL